MKKALLWRLHQFVKKDDKNEEKNYRSLHCFLYSDHIHRSVGSYHGMQFNVNQIATAVRHFHHSRHSRYNITCNNPSSFNFGGNVPPRFNLV
jgi:hypothetical protein